MRAHDFYIDSFKLPITPEDIEVNYKGKNKAIDLLNGDELNVLNKPSLTTFKFDFFLPRDYAPIVGEYIEPFTVVDGIEKMMNEKKIARINQLAAKSKTAEGLTPEEKQEQLALRREYIDSVVGNLARELDNTYVVDEHGNKRKLRRKGEK